MDSKQAKILVKVFELNELFQNKEELESLKRYNPQLVDAYMALVELSESDCKKQHIKR